MKKQTSLYFFILFIITFGCSTKEETNSTGTVKAGNLTIYYERTGKGHPVVLLHAGLQDHTMWEEQVKALSKDYDVITPDLPYHGKSTGKDTAILASEVIKILLDSLQLQKIAIAGLSMGASIVQDFITAYPQRVTKVVLLSTGINGYEKIQPVDSVSMAWYPPFEKALTEKDTAKAAAAFTKAWAEGVYRSKDSLGAPVSKYVYRTTLANLHKHKMEGWPKLQNNPPVIEKIATVSLPVLIIDGDKDLPYISVSSAHMAKAIKGSKRVVIKDVAHMLNMEKPEEVNKLLIDFLKN
ncbi:MAG TPA: alpha/beta hydrolase [Chitinophagaceae bacterium]|nr:alpha/beta hydrolase [Chitinophagaceae bacterium]